MLKKIPRKDCLLKYPVFPLRSYDEDTDEEEFFYPKVIAGKWMEIDAENEEELTSNLSKELTNLIRSLGCEYLIILGDTDQSWISGMNLKRKDHRPLVEAVDFFLLNEINTKFNGGVEITIDQLETFFIHFYTLIRCGGPLPYFYFIDNSTRILGTIHYSGQISIDRFTEEADKLFEERVAATKFRNKG